MKIPQNGAVIFCHSIKVCGKFSAGARQVMSVGSGPIMWYHLTGMEYFKPNPVTQ